VSTLRTVLRPLLIALLALALAPAAASATVIDIAVAPASGADFGESHTVTGKITGPYGAPLVGRSVVLEARPYPFRKRTFKAVETATSGLDGRFAFDHAFDRNQQARVSAPEFPGDHSFVLPAYVFPRTALSFGLVRRNVIRLVQTYRTPKDVKLTAPTLFYVGKAGKKRAPLAAKVKTKPVRARGTKGKKGKLKKGRFRATAIVRIPRAWKGRFRYASCFPYNAGMGNPKLGCPKKTYKF
jgi:hypothetical protein